MLSHLESSFRTRVQYFVGMVVCRLCDLAFAVGIGALATTVEPAKAPGGYGPVPMILDVCE